MLVHPHIHDQTVGQELGKPSLEPGDESVFAHIPLSLGVPPCAADDVGRVVHGHVLFHHRRLPVGHGAVEKGGLCPEGAHRHHGDAAAAQPPVQRTAEAEDERLGGAVNVDVGDGLERGDGGDVDDLPALRHIGTVSWHMATTA